MATLAERFELAWKKSGLDKAEVERRASSTGKASGHLTHVIEGRRKQLRHDTIAAYARAFGVREEWLAREEGPMEPSEAEAQVAAENPVVRGIPQRQQPRVLAGGDPIGGYYILPEPQPETTETRRARFDAMNRARARHAEEHPHDDDIPEREDDYAWIAFARGRLAEAAVDPAPFAYDHARTAVAYAASQLPKFRGGGNSEIADMRWHYQVGLALARNEDPPERPAPKLPEPAMAPAPPPPEKPQETPAQKMARLDAEAASARKRPKATTPPEERRPHDQTLGGEDTALSGRRGPSDPPPRTQTRPKADATLRPEDRVRLGGKAVAKKGTRRN